MNNYKGYTIEKGVVKDPRGRVNTTDKNGRYHILPNEEYTLEELMTLCGVSKSKPEAKVVPAKAPANEVKAEAPAKTGEPIKLDEPEKEMLHELEVLAHVDKDEKKSHSKKH